MVNKKKRLFKILFFPISLLICLSIFIINSFAQSGFTIESNGDIKSLNKIDLNDFYSERVNTSVGYNNIIITVNNDVWAYVEFKIKPNVEYSLSFDSNNSGKYVYSIDGNSLFNIDFTSGHFFRTFTSNSDYLRFYVSWGTAETKSLTLSNIMLNEGNIVLDYFPFGYYVDNTYLSKMSLYNLFNGSTVALNGYYGDLTNSYTMAIDILNLSVDQKFITLDDLPSIKNVIANGSGGSDWIVNADTYYITFYLNKQQANFSILFADFVSSKQYIRLSGSYNGIYDKFIYNTNENSQSFLLSTNGVEYSALSLFNELGYNQNFQISLSFSSSAYNDGYNDGYTSAINSSDAFNSGFNSGYQNGYNDGINTDLQTNGLRTLFNSILSFPVDMIKSVFNFEFMGVNIASVIMFIVSIGIVAFVLKKFL